MVEGAVEDSAAETGFGEHAFDEGFEFYEAVVEFGGYWALELELICLETAEVRFRCLLVCFC